MIRTALTACFVLAPPVAAQGFTSFEDLPSGGFTTASTEIGILSASEGEAAIDGRHARTGKTCLRLYGGESSRVELSLAGGLRPVAEVAFWAERWTRAEPFAFSVEAHGSDGWREVYQGSDHVRVGARFLSEVRFDVGGEIDRLRFTCSARPDTGILIDDLEVVAPGPLELGTVGFVRPALPVLVGNPWNPIGRVDLDVRGTDGQLDLTRVVVDLAGTTDLEALGQVALFRGPATLDHNDPRAALAEGMRFGEAQSARAGKLVFHDTTALSRGQIHVWIAVSLADAPDLDARVMGTCREVQVGDEVREPEFRGGGGAQRLGVALRSKGDDGSGAFRIPGLVTTNEGTLIAVYDVRWRGWGDLPGDIDVGMSRSTDGGRTWEPQRLIMDMGGDDKGDWSGDGIGDPALLVDRETNAIHVLATWSHGNRGWNGSGPGLKPTETGQLMLVESRDDGRTWGAPRNLTDGVKDPAWSYLLQGPGRGITMHDGTLVFPAQYQASPDEGRTPYSTVLFSRDRGVTWKVGTGAKSQTTEAAVVELADGVLMLNMRDNRGGTRSVYTSGDLGESWEAHPTTRKALIEPVCMASLIHVGRELDGKPDGRMLFSNPHVSAGPRRQMTLQASTDFGASWLPASLMLDEGQQAGYSCLTMIDADTVGILYEGSRAHMTFQRVPLADLFPAEASRGGR